MVKIMLIPVEEFHRIWEAAIDKYEKLALIADMCRANTLACVKRAGSGHLGSSFSAMDIIVWLYYAEMNTVRLGFTHPDRDIYFSSKGHDVPALYSVLFSLGILTEEKFLKLRRLGGLDGHPDVGVPGIEANSGSLGMGISKGRGMAWAKRKLRRGGQVFVMTGDGELQEGQNYEALQSTVHQGVTNLTVVVDHNHVQTDRLVSEIIDLGNLESKFSAFGWRAARCEGHDFRELERAFQEFRSVTDKPKVLIADTIKGRGVSFMEHPSAIPASRGLYPWHAGAPGDKAFTAAFDEIIGHLNHRLEVLGTAPIRLKDATPGTKGGSSVSKEYVAEAFGQALVELGGQRSDLVVLDGDLAADCRLRSFERAYPERFVENGIAEQDMVSMAGGLARQGLLPVVNTFASFLAARANEQIYNNATENTKIIYACHYAGLIPSGPGKSHQSIRDISLFGALPNFVIIQPCNAMETRMAVEYCVNQAAKNCVLRLVIGPSPRIIDLPQDYKLKPGHGVTLADGGDALLFAYGPVMLHESLAASEMLHQNGFGLKVVNMPWLNQCDLRWLAETVAPHRVIYVLEDHAPVGGLGDHLLDALSSAGLLNGRKFHKFAVEGFPACGIPREALRFHALDGASLARRVLGEEPLVCSFTEATEYSKGAPK